jgi:hypothetical protein
MVAVATLEVGVLLHAIRLAWCLGCWSNYDRNAFPKTERTELSDEGEGIFPAWGYPEGDEEKE